MKGCREFRFQEGAGSGDRVTGIGDRGSGEVFDRRGARQVSDLPDSYLNLLTGL